MAWRALAGGGSVGGSVGKSVEWVMMRNVVVMNSWGSLRMHEGQGERQARAGEGDRQSSEPTQAKVNVRTTSAESEHVPSPMALTKGGRRR